MLREVDKNTTKEKMIMQEKIIALAEKGGRLIEVDCEQLDFADFKVLLKQQTLVFSRKDKLSRNIFEL